MIEDTARSHQQFYTELPGKEIEAKFDVRDSTNGSLLIEKLRQAFLSIEGNFEIFIDDAVKVSKIKILKYRDSDGTFSVHRRENGTHNVKRKTDKQRRTTVVSMNDVQKDQYGTEIPHEIIARSKFIASFIRQKIRFHIQNQKSGRIFSVDWSYCETRNGKNLEPLQQVEVEYQGMMGPSIDSDIATVYVIDNVVDETHELSRIVFRLLKSNGYRPQHTFRTKGQWLQGK